MKLKRLRCWLQNQALSVKVLLIIVMACGIVMLGNYGTLRLVYNSYDEQLYIKTAQVFISFIEQVESELNNIDTITLSMIGDSSIQSKLEILRIEPKGSKNWLTAKREFSLRVDSYLHNMDLFSSFGVFKDERVLAGFVGNLTEEDKEELFAIADAGKGASRIVMHNNQLYYVRQIRQSKGFSFLNLGTMIGVLDIEKIMGKYAEIYINAGIALDLVVYVDDTCIYSDSAIIKPLCEDGWEIRDNYFVVQSTNKREWKFLVYTSYDEIHRAIRMTKFASFGITAVVAIVAMLIGHILVVRITHHLDALMYKFDTYRKGMLPSQEDIKMYENRKDEIGRLHRQFDSMAYEYKELNDEIYNRMLLQKETQYKQLQQQIQPHFIFNALSTIMWMAYEHNDLEIAELSNALSRMMRESMSFSEKTIKVEDELKLIEDYMLIQRKRFGERLHFEMCVPEELYQVLIPQMTIQPIVDNAVKYALEDMLEACEIKVWGKREGNRAIFIVEDNGPGIDTDILNKLFEGQINAQGNGIGLQNIQKRIQLVYSEEYGLEFHRVNNHTQVWICVPFKCSEEEQSV